MAETLSLLPVLLVLIANALGLNNTELTVILGEGEEFAPGTLARAMRMKTMLNVAEITAGIFTAFGQHTLATVIYQVYAQCY